MIDYNIICNLEKKFKVYEIGIKKVYISFILKIGFGELIIYLILVY